MPVLLDEACPRIEIVAENVLGNRTQAVKIFKPQYKKDGSVAAYKADHANFTCESATLKPQEYRIRCYPIPYRLPKGAAGGGLTAHVDVGDAVGEHKFELAPSAGVRGPFLGPVNPKPPAVKKFPKEVLPAKGPAGPQTRAIIRTRYTKTVEPEGLNAKAKTARIVKDPNFCWISEPLKIVPEGIELNNTITAKRGDFIRTYVGEWLGPHIRQPQRVAVGGFVGTLSIEEDFNNVLSPKAVAADIIPIPDSGMIIPLPSLKNGDIIRVAAFSILAEPTPRLCPRQHKFDEDKIIKVDKQLPPYELETGAQREVHFGLFKSRDHKVQLNCVNDAGQDDPYARDEYFVTSSTKVRCWSARRGDAGDGSYGPGRSRVLLSEARRLITQEYLPDDKVAELEELRVRRFQILPGGYLKQHLLKSTVTTINRTLEVTKRWYVGDKPSVQPAARGTNPRVAGPGTHRVQGRHTKVDDGSVYVHSGEFYQAAEDLHLKGKMTDVVLRRTHLSHSLFTTPLGRNWDFIGNMRLVELLGGEVMLMNGEAGIETYAPKSKDPGAFYFAQYVAKFSRSSFGEPISPKVVTSLAQHGDGQGGFNYSSLHPQSQYTSPDGVYRSLLKALPVEMEGMPLEKAGAERARFYLVDKHGTVFTFAEDMRYRTGGTDSGDNNWWFASPDPSGFQEHEPPPGVAAQYVLIAIHHRVQKSYIKLQRNGKGQVEGIIDDMGRVLSFDYKLSIASFDKFLEAVRDFTGRRVEFDRTRSLPSGQAVSLVRGSLLPDLVRHLSSSDVFQRNLASVRGPAVKRSGSMEQTNGGQASPGAPAGIGQGNLGNRLEQSLARTGLLTEVNYGPGSEILRETTGETQGIREARRQCGEDMLTLPPGQEALKKLKDAIRTAARKLASSKCSISAIYSKVTYKRDGRSRVSEERRLWARPSSAGDATSGESVSSAVSTHNSWAEDDQLLKRWMEMDIEVKTDEGPEKQKRVFIDNSYDIHGRPISEKVGPVKKRTKYDRLGNPREVKQQSHTIGYTHDQFGRVIKAFEERKDIPTEDERREDDSMARIGAHSDFKGGSKNNIFRDLQNMLLQERFKVENDGTLRYRVDIKGVGPRKSATT